MKMMSVMRSIGVAVVATCGLLTSSGLAFAGTKATNPVYINNSSGYATGSIGSARESSDGYQYIGCSSYGTNGYCIAEDSAGNFAECAWSGATQQAAVESITPMSNLVLNWNTTTGGCTSIQVSNFSYWPPAAP
jgi:hypothetical protein